MNFQILLLLLLLPDLIFSVGSLSCFLSFFFFLFLFLFCVMWYPVAMATMAAMAKSQVKKKKSGFNK